ncbi:MAG: XrtV sorting system accessory protein [Sphingomicrobium sp.]
MKTIYDVISLAIFAGLVVLLLQRSTAQDADEDAPLLLYLLAGGGCAAANYFGNKGDDAIGIALIVATIAFIFYFLKPFSTFRRP